MDEGFWTPALRGRGGAYNRPLTRPIATARYFLARRRFAQYAFSRFDMAFLAAALIGARFRFCVAVGCAGEAALAFLRFAQYAFIRALRATLHAARGFLGFGAALACGLTVG